jgi:hypothetical protein
VCYKKVKMEHVKEVEAEGIDIDDSGKGSNEEA